MGEDTKKHELKRIQAYLVNASNFLQNYLPLANAHGIDFIVKSHWNKFVPEQIRTELLSLTEEQLISLPDINLTTMLFASNPTHETLTSEEPYSSSSNFDSEVKNKPVNTFTCSSEVSISKNENSKSDEDEQLSAGENKSTNKEFLKYVCPNWIHTDLGSFLKDARGYSLPCSGLVLSLQDYREKHELSEKQTHITPKDFMNQKKHHEIGVMGSLCSSMARKYDIDVICDVGSGKGYLGTQLSFQHEMLVLGIDAAKTNTLGAVKRSRLLQKQWNGLIHNAKSGKQTHDHMTTTTPTKPSTQTNSMEQTCDKARLKGSQMISEDPNSIGTFAYSDVGGNRPSATSYNQNKPKNIDAICDELNSVYHHHNSTKTWKCRCSHDVESSENRNVENEKLKSVDLVTFTCSQDKQTEEQKQNICSINSGMTKDLHKVPMVTRQVSANACCSQKNFGQGFTKGPSLSLYVPVTLYLDSSTDLSSIVKENFQSLHTNKSNSQRLMLTGLHTCGSLGSSVLKVFTENPSVSVLNCVSCCYHWMEEEFVDSPFLDAGESNPGPSFPMSSFLKQQKIGLGRTARNLASQSIERLVMEKTLQGKKFYQRALLQVIIRDLTGTTSGSWTGLRKLDQRCKDTYDYVTQAFKKLGISEQKITAEFIKDYCDTYREEEKRLASFFQLRASLAPCIESIVLLDRVCYLLEQDTVEDVKLVRLFDPVISPRCYGIIALKKASPQDH